MPNPVGRPSKYTDDICEKLMKHMGKGFSFESFAPIAGVDRATLYNWEKSFPEFLDAKRFGQDLSLLFWESQGIDGLWTNKERQFNTAVWVINMKNRHKWKDRLEDEQVPQQITIMQKNISEMTPQQLVDMIQQLKKPDTIEVESSDDNTKKLS